MLCPLCNGLGAEPDNCNICGSKVTECGRTSDWTGPYEPYEPYAPLAEDLLNGYSQANAVEYCCHVVYCENCKRVNEISVAQWPSIH